MHTVDTGARIIWAWPGYWYWDEPYVYPWATYDLGEPTNDVLSAGLPEGMLQPGGQVTGFIYFQRQAADASRLVLTWTPRDENGKPVATLSVPFVVVK